MKKLEKYTLLYAEDETIIRMNITKQLQEYFQKIYTATNGKEALEQFFDYRPDIVILDINMPYFSGLEVAKKIREKNKEIPIVILTAYSDLPLLLNAVELNLTKYIIKPITKDKLKEMIEAIEDKLEQPNYIYLKHGYYFDVDKQILYNSQNQEIHLTKNEIKFINSLSKSKYQFISTETIEYDIWGELSFEIDCKKRLKSLLAGLRKKIPKDIIKNNYSLGYKLEY